MPSEAKASKPFVRPATREDCIFIAEHLRAEDREEISHSSGLTAEQSILLGWHSTNAYSVVLDGEPIAIFGVNGWAGKVGFPWMLATDGLLKVKKTFLRECRGYAQAMLKVYGRLENHVWAKNEVHIQWLKWLGFTIEPATPHGIDGEPFHHFYMKEH